MKRPTITTVLAVLAASLAAQSQTSVPRLVVGLTIDQLRSDYMDAFSPLYGEDGFKRLMREGVFFSNAQYSSADVDRASAIASIFTGTVPYNHGIVGEDWMDRQSMRPVQCVEDFKIRGINTQETASPKNLLVSTIGDELKLSSNGRAMVYGIAPNREASVLSVGHAGDFAIWLDGHTGKWAGTSYYAEQPSWYKYLTTKSISGVDQVSWKPKNAAVTSYNYYLASEKTSSFNHRFTGKRRFRSFKTSGLINDFITETASFVITQAGMGRDDVPDFLSLCYYAGSFDGKTFNDSATEIQDTYVRLDEALANLFKEIDKSVGIENTLFFITSTGFEDAEAADLSKYRIPTGTLHLNRCAALLNMYLMAIYGQGQYVESYYDNQFYLNHKLIEQKQLNLAEVLETCEDFLFQYTGVRDVYTSTRLTQGAWTPGISRIRNSFNPKCSGDILILANPGWTLANDDIGQSRQVRDSFFEFPIIFFGFQLKAERIATPVTVDCIAPTVAHFMRIRAPNGCNTSPLSEVRRR